MPLTLAQKSMTSPFWRQLAPRDAAMKELSKIVETAEPVLRQALEASPSPEARRRIEQLLAKLDGYGTTGEPLRQARAIEVLEHIATPEARFFRNSQRARPQPG